jgi:hypothetical protein
MSVSRKMEAMVTTGDGSLVFPRLLLLLGGSGRRLRGLRMELSDSMLVDHSIRRLRKGHDTRLLGLVQSPKASPRYLCLGYVDARPKDSLHGWFE